MYSVLILSGISNQPAWWKVDLGASYDVYQVRIVNRDLGQGEFLLARLESAYSLIWGAHKIWGQDIGTFMISRPI